MAIKDSEATLHLLYKHQRDFANLPGNPHLYSCDFCIRRNMLACEAECHPGAWRVPTAGPAFASSCVAHFIQPNVCFANGVLSHSTASLPWPFR
ncbi:hypothetical protein T492DRAFT_873635 [Pavlovales sp. CCMP2436]|nr:hypothetical protein T492DRAFT_873635 [Pavlovales sp. CCMP2436]